MIEITITNGGAIWTVPVNKTFIGRIVVTGCCVSGTLGVSAATGGTLAAIAQGAGTTVPSTSVVDVVITGGGAGNALTGILTGANSAGVALVVGHWK